MEIIQILWDYLIHFLAVLPKKLEKNPIKLQQETIGKVYKNEVKNRNILEVVN